MDQSRIDEIETVQSSLPEFLRRTRAQIESDEKVQELRRASFTRAHLTEEERTISQGKVQEEIALANLSTALELQGRYADAAEIAPQPEERERLLATQKAIDSADDVFCDCEHNKFEEKEIDPHFEVRRVFSLKHGKMVSLVGCAKCDSLNATPTPPAQLQAILNAQSASAAAKKPISNDKQILNGTVSK